MLRIRFLFLFFQIRDTEILAKFSRKLANLGSRIYTRKPQFQLIFWSENDNFFWEKTLVVTHLSGFFSQKGIFLLEKLQILSGKEKALVGTFYSFQGSPPQYKQFRQFIQKVQQNQLNLHQKNTILQYFPEFLVLKMTNFYEGTKKLVLLCVFVCFCF